MRQVWIYLFFSKLHCMSLICVIFLYLGDGCIYLMYMLTNYEVFEPKVLQCVILSFAFEIHLSLISYMTSLIMEYQMEILVGLLRCFNV